MAPTWHQIQKDAITPYLAGEITQKEAFETGIEPVRKFMFKQTRQKDLELFLKLGNYPRPENKENVPTVALIPAFAISELKLPFRWDLLFMCPLL